MIPRHHQNLPLPYQHLDQNRDLSRLSADIPYEDKNLIKGICPKKGILNQLTQNLFASICHNLRKNGLTHYSPDNEQQFIALIVRGCSFIESIEPRPGQYGLRPTPQPCAKSPGCDFEHRYLEESVDRGQSGEQAGEGTGCAGEEDCRVDEQVSQPRQMTLDNGIIIRSDGSWYRNTRMGCEDGRLE